MLLLMLLLLTKRVAGLLAGAVVVVVVAVVVVGTKIVVVAVGVAVVVVVAVVDEGTTLLRGWTSSKKRRIRPRGGRTRVGCVTIETTLFTIGSGLTSCFPSSSLLNECLLELIQRESVIDFSIVVETERWINGSQSKIISLLSHG